jgi:hypothetical protein
MGQQVANSGRICLSGSSFDTGNMGVSALARSPVVATRTIQLEACIVLLVAGMLDCREAPSSSFGQKFSTGSPAT